MSLAYQSWEMSSGPSISCAAEAKGKQRVCACETDCMVHSGLSIIPVGLQSQRPTDLALKDTRFVHDVYRSGEGNMPSNCLKFSCSAASSTTRQDLRVLAKPALKGTSSGEVNRTSSLWNSYGSKLSAVAEDKPWDSPSPTASQDNGSSLSSLSHSEESSSGSLEDVSEVQSRYKSPLASMCSLEDALPCKRGLSGFFAGKSKSFSCLADVTSIAEIAKPENAYNRRRKYISACIGNGERLRLHPTRSGALGISKKCCHNSKYTVALAIALSTDEGKPAARFARNAAPSRSFSLSDLQVAGSPPSE